MPSPRPSSREREDHPASGGQTLVESALIALLLITFLMGIVDLGRVIYHYNVLSNVAREGARYGSLIRLVGDTPTVLDSDCADLAPTPVGQLAIGLYSSAADMADHVGMKSVSSLANATLQDSDLHRCVQPAYPTTSTTYVVFRATYEFNAVTPLIQAFLPSGGLPLSATSVMKVNY